MPGGSIRTIVCVGGLCALCFALVTPPGQLPAAEPGRFLRPSSNSRGQRQQVLASLPMQRLTREAQHRILSIANSPTLYRRLPAQAIRCDRDMFLFLTRNPDVMVGIWDLMGITKVQIKRTGPYQLEAIDGSGTTCQIDLVYGDPNLHIYVAQGSYDGKLVAKPIRGKGVFILRSNYASGVDGSNTVNGTIDCFIQLESLGADLVARTLSGMIGRSADNNFIETARFVAQVSQASERNPDAMIDVAQRLPQVMPPTKRQFVDVITTVANRVEQDKRVAHHHLFVPSR